ncbi:hypothetical protein DSO57_1012440 [Entomophthora muscae]|uniref:Uncharacterized protein n=1 Tax=Entomophthora muscae TaxID=34485 RepID=A0ACC2S7V7_9FUNG|nr:hypothetical protein DSO57_1012440 [Entomophthora muscae]
MTPPLTPRLNRPLEPVTAAETTSTQLFGVLYITLTGLVDSMVLNSGAWSLLRQSVSYIIKLAPIIWWALPTGPVIPHPEPSNASPYAWLPEKVDQIRRRAGTKGATYLGPPRNLEDFGAGGRGHSGKASGLGVATLKQNS